MHNVKLARIVLGALIVSLSTLYLNGYTVNISENSINSLSQISPENLGAATVALGSYLALELFSLFKGHERINKFLADHANQLKITGALTMGGLAAWLFNSPEARSLVNTTLTNPEIAKYTGIAAGVMVAFRAIQAFKDS